MTERLIACVDGKQATTKQFDKREVTRQILRFNTMINDIVKTLKSLEKRLEILEQEVFYLPIDFQDKEKMLKPSAVKKSLSGNKVLILCPKHTEETPSHLINLNDKSYYCFSCGLKGTYTQDEIKQLTNH